MNNRRSTGDPSGADRPSESVAALAVKLSASPGQQLVYDMDSGKHFVINPKKMSQDMPTDAVGDRRPAFRYGLSGFYTFKQRLIGAERIRDETISAHQST